MTEYNYKNFKIFYNIESDTNKNLYTADGYVTCSLDETQSLLSRKFHTEDTTRTGAQHEIRRLIENYIDFEWSEFYEVHGKTSHLRR
mgnify:CR=1 FL=1